MSENQGRVLYGLESDQKIGSVIIYTATGICWGDVIVKEYVRVSTWLRTNAAPDIVCLRNARMLITTAPMELKPMLFSELYLPLAQIMAYHLVPPAKDPIDYDPSEPNRRMDPVTAVIGMFRIDGLMRMSTRIDLGHYLDVAREPFSAIYEAEITSPVMPAFQSMRTPFILVRQADTLFATRTA